MAISQKAANNLADKNQIDRALIDQEMARELSGEAAVTEPYRVPYRVGVTLYRSMCHASRFFRELRDNGIFYAGKCPVCGHVMFPPMRPICRRCIVKGKYVEYELFPLGPEVIGTVLSWSKLVRGTSKHVGKGELYPSIIKVDAADNAEWQYVLPEEGKEIKVGAKVRSVLLPPEDRTGEVNDFAFRLI
jgi:uncharacterized OB-fold protein